MVSPGRGRDLDQMRQIDSIADEFELAFHSGERPRIEEYLARVPVSLRQLLLHELLRIDLEWLQRWGQTVLPQDYLQRFPQHRELVQSALESAGAWPAELIDSTEPAGETQPAAVGSSVIRCPGRFGRFELQRPLGTGGFGTVFLAQDTQLGRQVALKIPKVSEGNRRFLAEARAAAKLEHPNIVAVHDSGTIEGNLFIVCRFVDGEDLSSFVKHHPHSLRQLVTWIRDAARALAHAHSQGVIHRDIKPGNLLISRDGQVYVADFGLARRVEDSSSLTADGTVLGTPAYMAPEQAAGRTTDIGTHSDQYSLGVVLYELLTGRRPFLGNVREVLQKVIHTPAPPPRMLHPKVPVELEAICLRAMAKDPNARYPSMGAFADDLDRWLQLRAQQTVASGGEGFQLGKLLKSGWFQAACAVAVLGALGMGGLVLSLLSSGGDASRTDTVRPSPKATLPAANPSVASVDDAPAEDPRDAVEQRSREQFNRLQAAMTLNSAWELPTIGDSTPAILTIVETPEESKPFTALLSDARDDSIRDAWSGRIRQLPPGSHPSGALWAAAFTPLIRTHNLPAAEHRVLTFAALDEQGLAWIDLDTVPAVHKVAKPEGLPQLDELRLRVESAATPGMVWEGTYQPRGEATRKVKMVFTDYRDSGQHVRATLQSADDPHSMAPFVGTLDWNPVTLMAGQPIRLVRKSAAMGANDDWPIFATPYLNPEIHLGLADEGVLVGTAGSDALRLTSANNDPEPFQRTAQWATAVEPGSTWRGLLTYLDNPPTPVKLTIAEVRDNLRYVRMLCEREEDPHYFTLYEGAVDVNDEIIDGYALSLNFRGRGARKDDIYHSLFPSWDDARHGIRLSADGETLYLRSQSGERVTLTRDRDIVSLPLDRTSFEQAWQLTCQPVRTWIGAVHNTEFDQRSTIVMQFATAPDSLGNLQAVIGVADRPATRMGFIGNLRADTDVAVNGFALKLQKAGSGAGPSVLFGKEKNSILHLRLSSDGRRLIGMAANDGARWTEFIELADPTSPDPNPADGVPRVPGFPPVGNPQAGGGFAPPGGFANPGGLVPGFNPGSPSKPGAGPSPNGPSN